MKSHTLSDLIAQGEHQQQDFKYEISSVSKIAHSISAFANTDGGRLLIGVRDNGKIAGVRSEEEMYMIDAAATSYCCPPVKCQWETVTENGHTVLIVTIDRSENRPVRAKEKDGSQKAYVRIKDENIVASPVHLELWRKYALQNGSFIQFTERQRNIFKLLSEKPEGYTLNQFYKKSGLNREKAIKMLANFIYLGIAEMVFRDHTFYFIEKSPE
jgi:predicted HTH transcriptional regulator